MNSDNADLQHRRRLVERFFTAIPHSRVLGLEVVEVGVGVVVARLPYAKQLVGNPVTGVVHGGVITTLVDQTSGSAVFTATGQSEAIATLDLRIDYLSPATPGEAVLARAHCYRVTRQIAFVRCAVYHRDPEDPIATSVSTFMRASSEESVA
jgi:uncharacterized protein (TIGR00369 family)